MAAEFEALSDEDLARQTQSGSLPAFEQLVYRYEKRIYGFVVNTCRNMTDAREITQDSFVRAFRAIAQFDPRHDFASWLFTIARRKCIDHFRSTRRETGELAPDLPGTDDPAELLARNEDRQDLWNLARRALPAVQFHALWLRYVEDMNVAQIARALHKSQAYVKVLLFRARRSLAHRVEQGPASLATTCFGRPLSRQSTLADSPLKSPRLSSL